MFLSASGRTLENISIFENNNNLQIALMIANAICSFLQPSIYESIILLKNLPFLTDLPPSRIS